MSRSATKDRRQRQHPGYELADRAQADSEAGEEGGSGALPTINDINRAISDDGADVRLHDRPATPGRRCGHGSTKSCDGYSSTTVERSINPAGCQVYLWHECAGGRCADGESGVTNMISDGQEPAEDGFAVISVSGSDIFFETSTRAGRAGHATSSGTYTTPASTEASPRRRLNRPARAKPVNQPIRPTFVRTDENLSPSRAKETSPPARPHFQLRRRPSQSRRRAPSSSRTR